MRVGRASLEWEVAATVVGPSTAKISWFSVGSMRPSVYANRSRSSANNACQSEKSFWRTAVRRVSDLG